MRRYILVLLGLMALHVTNAARKIKSANDSVSYALGYIVGTQQITSTAFKKYGCDKELFLQAMSDAMNGLTPEMTGRQAEKVMNNAIKRFKASQQSKKDLAYKAAKDENGRFMANNLKNKSYKEIPNSWDSTMFGIQRRIIKKGEGETPTVSSAVKFYYTMRLLDGTVVARTNASEPVESMVNTLLPGLQDALTNMPVGAKWEIVIPSELGFDKDEQLYDDGRVMVPANSILIAELELLNAGTPEQVGGACSEK